MVSLHPPSSFLGSLNRACAILPAGALIAFITQANRNTIKVRLRELVVEGYLIKQDKGKGTHYLSGQHSF
jgi:hypothetical protein